MNDDIRVGDVVTVRTGNVPMSVESLAGTTAHCTWFEQACLPIPGSESFEHATRWYLRRGRFHVESLDLESRE